MAKSKRAFVKAIFLVVSHDLTNPQSHTHTTYSSCLVKREHITTCKINVLYTPSILKLL
jgi:hypothetical protein